MSHFLQVLLGGVLYRVLLVVFVIALIAVLVYFIAAADTRERKLRHAIVGSLPFVGLCFLVAFRTLSEEWVARAAFDMPAWGELLVAAVLGAALTLRGRALLNGPKLTQGLGFVAVLSTFIAIVLLLFTYGVDQSAAAALFGAIFGAGSCIAALGVPIRPSTGAATDASTD
jgi:hypothetical protein